MDAELSVPNRQQQHGLNGPASSWSCSQPEALIADKELYRLQMQSAGYNSGNSSWPEDALEHPLHSFRGHVGTQVVGLSTMVAAPAIASVVAVQRNGSSSRCKPVSPAQAAMTVKAECCPQPAASIGKLKQ